MPPSSCLNWQNSTALYRFCLLEHYFEVFGLGKRPARADCDHIALLGLIAGIVRGEFGGLLHKLLVLGVFDVAGNCHHRGVLHLVRDNLAAEFFLLNCLSSVFHMSLRLNLGSPGVKV